MGGTLIESLRIENLAIVEEAELEFEPGLNVLTGETGAGKSIVLGALALLLGERPAPGVLREGAEQGGVEALFCTEGLEALEAELQSKDLVAAGDAEAHELVVRRSLTAGGRSRARVGGQLVPAATLAELLGGRLEISSQHSSQALLRTDTHGWLLDSAGGLLKARQAVSEAFGALRRLEAELETLQAEAAERERQRDFIAYQLAEIDEVGLQPGELDTLERDHARLAHADALRREGSEALIALRGDEAGVVASAADRLAEAARAGEGMARMDAGLEGWAARVRSLGDEVFEAARELDHYVEGLEADSSGLDTLETRLAAIEKLRRKYGRDEAEILATRDALALEREGLEGAGARIEELIRDREPRRAELATAAKRLTQGRKRAARALSKAVEAGLKDLAMPEARFSILLESADPSGWPEGAVSGPAGSEKPEFLFSANPGEPPQPLRKVASGGELSRVFLAAKNALRKAGGGMVLVFDEVDAGMGGRAAERVGRALADLAESHQVLCITHLPQIAAFAQRHFRVEKAARGGRTRTRIGLLDPQERVEEIARMAAGEDITEATRKHARALLRAATTR